MKPSFVIDAENGLVYGPRGRPIRHRNRQGYVQARYLNRYYAVVHRMIWEHVHGPIPDGMQINHINGNKSDNRIQNLELVTQSENALHAYRTGLQRADGEFNGRRIAKRRREAEQAA